MKIKKEDNKKKQMDYSRRLKSLVLAFLYRYFNFFIILSMIFIVILGNKYILKPKRQEINKNIEIANAEREMEKADLEDLLKRINRYKGSYLNIDQLNRDKIDKLLPNEPKINDLFVQMEDLFQEEGLLIESLAIAEIEKKDSPSSRSRKKSDSDDAEALPEPVGVIEINTELSGVDYFSLLELLERIEKNLRLIDIKNMDFDPDNLKLTLEMNAYYLK